MQCAAVCCSVIQRAMSIVSDAPQNAAVGMCCSVSQCIAVCCSVLQCDAVCCSVMQCDAV